MEIKNLRGGLLSSLPHNHRAFIESELTEMYDKCSSKIDRTGKRNSKYKKLHFNLKNNDEKVH